MKIFKTTSNDWVEDFDHENGRYLNRCCECSIIFEGHKRRVICKVCSIAADAQWENLTDREKHAKLEERNKLINEFFKKNI